MGQDGTKSGAWVGAVGGELSSAPASPCLLTCHPCCDQTLLSLRPSSRPFPALGHLSSLPKTHIRKPLSPSALTPTVPQAVPVVHGRHRLQVTSPNCTARPWASCNVSPKAPSSTTDSPWTFLSATILLKGSPDSTSACALSDSESPDTGEQFLSGHFYSNTLEYLSLGPKNVKPRWTFP